MKYKTLGKTGLDVSVLSFGTAGFGGAYGASDPQEMKRAVHYAVDHGINYFDSSPYYGLTVSETRLGDALSGGYRQKIFLATKCGRYDLSLPDGFDFTRERIMRSIDESLQRLQTDYLDVFKLHDVEFWDKQRILDEAVPAMVDIKKSGKARFIGVTGYPVHLLRDIVEATDMDMTLTYCRANLLDMSADEVLRPTCERNQVGMINASPLHMGMLTDDGPPDWHPAPQRVKDAARQAAELCRSRGASLPKLAIQYALGYEYAASLCVGMLSVDEVKHNLDVLNSDVDTELMAAVRTILEPVRNTYWKSGLPENDDPGAVDQYV